MDTAVEQIEKAALLHDIGKLIQRAYNRYQKGDSHSRVGVEFLQNYAADLPAEILRAVANHHGEEISKAKLNRDDISYIVYEADNIASGIDRRENEGGLKGGFKRKLPLESVFNSLGENTAKYAFKLRGLLQTESYYPQPADEIIADREDYTKLAQFIEVNFRQKSVDDMTVNELLSILAATMSYVPSSTQQKEIADISLYDHLKMTAAFAAAMYKYFQANDIADYYSACYKNPREYRAKNMYLLVSGKISGIADFIYNVPSKGALKSLRGRSFYLEIMTEHLADEILAALGLSRANLLYTGGGEFSMLLPNTSEVDNILKQAKARINHWFLAHYGTRLYLSLAATVCMADELMADGTGAGNIYARLTRYLSSDKLKGYEDNELRELFNPNSSYNLAQGERECAICHNSAISLKPYGEFNDIEVCPSCYNLYELGKMVLNDGVLTVLNKKIEPSIAMPALSENTNYYLAAIAKDKLPDLKADIVRMYIKNEMQTGEKLATNILIADYTQRDADSSVLDFQKLAMLSGSDSKGIKRLGVLRADVDDLAAAFVEGFPERIATLSRTATLSRNIALFFKYYINDLCAGKLIDQFSLFGYEKNKARNVHVIYSGGDKFFLVGAWDDLLELAVDIYNAFSRFTNKKLSFSAGFGLFHADYPIAAMARDVEALVINAKKFPDKNAIALFGLDDNACYSWDSFINKVCSEKLAFLRQHFNIFAGSSNRLPLGKSLIYRLLTLLRGSEKINLARLAYTIARLEPNGGTEEMARHYAAIRKQIYIWSKDKQDRQELVTALELVVYGLRDKGDL